MIRVRLAPAAAETLFASAIGLEQLGWQVAETDPELGVATFAERRTLEFPAPPALLLLARPDDLTVLAREASAAPVDVAVLPVNMAELRLRSRCLARFAAAMPTESCLAGLATTGRIAAEAAHESRNALTYVLSSVEFIRTALGQHRFHDPQLPAAAEDAIEGVQRAIAAARNILDLAKGRPRAPQPTAAREAVQRAVALVNPFARFQVELSMELDELPPVRADPPGLVQVLVNLLVNGCEAAGRHGRVRVRAFRDGSAVVLAVADSGPGVPPEAADDLFRPFRSGKPDSGSGLGLTVSQAIVRASGGSLSVRPGPLGGAEFALALPVAEALS